MIPSMSPNLQLALTKAREAKLQERAATARLLKRAGSKAGHFQPGTMAMFSLLLTNKCSALESRRQTWLL